MKKIYKLKSKYGLKKCHLHGDVAPGNTFEVELVKSELNLVLGKGCYLVEEKAKLEEKKEVVAEKKPSKKVSKKAAKKVSKKVEKDGIDKDIQQTEVPEASTSID